MPIKSPTNNNVVPANARASDVATRAIQEVLKTQQTRYMSALRVQGYQGILYTRLKQGSKCTCQGAQKILNTRLGEDGKASEGTINKLLTGGADFGTVPYGSRPEPVVDVYNRETSSKAPKDKYQGVFDLAILDVSSQPRGSVVEEPSFADNGPINPDFDINDLAKDFDADDAGYTDSACTICFGTGFVGGYEAFSTYRRVYVPQDTAFSLKDSGINVATQPWECVSSSYVECKVLFPKGACSTDSFKILNGKLSVAANFTVDGVAISQISDLLQYCDGLPHTVGIKFLQPSTWTHFETQFAVSTDSPYFEFPKLTQGSDANLLDKTEPFQIIVGPNVPCLRTEDVIVESTFGKVLIVQNSNWWNTRDRNTLGWECQVRVSQPQEAFNVLPRRGRIVTKGPTLSTSHPNKPGNRS